MLGEMWIVGGMCFVKMTILSKIALKSCILGEITLKCWRGHLICLKTTDWCGNVDWKMRNQEELKLTESPIPSQLISSCSTNNSQNACTALVCCSLGSGADSVQRLAKQLCSLQCTWQVHWGWDSMKTYCRVSSIDHNGTYIRLNMYRIVLWWVLPFENILAKQPPLNTAA